MQKIDVNKIYAMNLAKMNFSVGGSESNIYCSDSKVYKIYRDIDCYGKNLNLNSRKNIIKILSAIKDLEEAILPDDMLVRNILFSSICMGYSMDRIKDYISLYDLCDDGNRDDEKYKAIINSSKALQVVHNRPEGIILSDANFSNVLLLPDANGDYVIPRFADFDSVKVEGVNTNITSIPSFLLKFFMDRINYIDDSKIDKNMDRLCYLLQFIYVVFGFNIYEINMDEYDKLSEEMKSLKMFRNIVLDLRDLYKDIPYIPYLHEILDINEQEAFSRRYEIMC